jgi:hypothetical protein
MGLNAKDVSGLIYDVAAPRASAMVESLRAFGYNIQTAIADLIDNSISAGAKNIWLSFCWDGENSHVSIRDDGYGMTEEKLIHAMRPGSQNPLEAREAHDLGRFGLGLKTATFSQCRRLTVASRAESHNLAIRRWDLDYVNQVDEWRLLHGCAKGSVQKLNALESMPHGTMVLWEVLDRVVGEAKSENQKAQGDFLETVEVVENHLAMVFHRFLEKRHPLNLWINSKPIEPWNPFLLDAQATQTLPLEQLIFKSAIIRVQPYILPHHSKINTATYNKAAGLNGWNAQQGFYVYRNERLLVAGDWLSLGYQKDEHCKLARIQIDLPNSMDSDWNIDIKKSRARPPTSLKIDLKRIARLTRNRATEIYRHRGKILARQSSGNYSYLWEQKVKHGKTSYSLNRSHPIIEAVLLEAENLAPKLKALLSMIEQTMPVPLIAQDHAERPYAQAQAFEGVNTEEFLEIITQVLDTLIKNGWGFKEARNCLSTMDPFQNHGDLIAIALDQYQKQENR